MAESPESTNLAQRAHRPMKGAQGRSGGWRPGRGARAAAGVFVVLAAFIVVIVIYALLFSSPMILRYGLPAGDKALRKSGFSITAESASGRPMSGMTFGGFEITHTDSTGQVARVFRADTLTVEYDLRKLIRRRWQLKHVYMKNPEILLAKAPEGGILMPGLRGARVSGRRKPEPAGKGFTLEIERIALENASLTVSKVGEDEIFEKMDLVCSFVRRPSGMEIGLESASFLMPARNLGISSVSARLSYADRELAMEQGLAQLESSAIAFSGRMTFWDGTRFDMRCRGHPFDSRELAAAFGADWPNGLLEGEAAVIGKTDSLTISAMLNGKVERFALENMQVRALRTRSEFSFSEAIGIVNGTSIEASGRLRRKAETFDVRFTNLDASRGFFKAASFPPTDLSGTARITHRGRESPWEITSVMGKGHAADFEFSSLLFIGRVTSEDVFVDTLVVNRPDLEAKASGRIGLGSSGQMDLLFSAEVDSLEYAARWLGAESLQGHVLAHGGLRGPSANPVLEASGTIGRVQRGPARLVGGSFDVIVDGLAGKGPVAFGVRDGRFSLASQPLGTARIEGVFAGGILEVPSFRLERGDSSIAGSFTLKSSDGRIEVASDSLEVGFNGASWQCRDPFTFSYDSGAYSVKGMRLSSDGGALAVSGRLDRAGEQIELDIAATGLDVSFLRLMGGKVGGGTLSGQVSLDGPLSSPEGDLELKWSEVKVYGQEVREATLKCELKADGMAVERLRLDSAMGQLLVTGTAGIRLDLRRLSGGSPGEYLRSLLEAPLDLSMSTSDLDLAGLWGLAQRDSAVAGRLSLSGSVRGSPKKPLLNLAVDASSLGARGISVDAVSGTLEYAERRLSIQRMTATRGGVAVHMEGYVPVELDASRGLDLLEDEPMVLDLKVTPGDFGVVADAWKGLASSSGTFVLDATVSGTPGSPSLSGSGRLQGCSLRLAGMEEEYRDINCDFSMTGNRIVMSQLKGREGKEGVFTGSGEITLAWPGIVDYTFDIELRRFAVLSPLDFDAVVNGELTVSSYVLANGGMIPQLAGVLEVQEAVYTGEIGGSAQLEAGGAVSGTVTPLWLGQLELQIPGNVWVSNSAAELELAGEILLVKDYDGIKPRGTLRVARGKYFLVNTEFTVTSGTITFEKAVGINPELDITAETTLGLGESGDQETIYVHLSGTGKDPTIRVSSTSGYSETDIYKMLLAGVLWGQGPQEPGSPDISALATNTLFNAIDARLRFLFGSRPPLKIGLTREETDYNSTGDPETRISVGRNLSPRFFLRYEQGFSAITRREVNLDYRVSRYLLLRSQVINNPDRGIREEASSEINIDLKLRYEF